MKRMYLAFVKFLVLAIIVLEFQVLGSNSWKARGVAIQCTKRERQALLHFKAGLGDDSHLLKVTWSSWGSKENKRDCCEWEGVYCNNQTGHVLMLDLHGEIFHQRKKLQGEISVSLMELQYLMYLNLSFNAFEGGHIPEFFSSLSNLRYLDLRSCHFGGKIPSQLGSLSHLRYLDLSFNSLQGSIPYQLGNLSQLQHLDLSYNNLIGAIPYQLANLSKLQKLHLGYGDDTLKIDRENGVGGEWLSHLTSLTHLMLGGITDLKYSHKWMQMIGKLPSLKELILSDNDLSDHYILLLAPLKFNSSDSLSFLGLYGNNFMSHIIFQWLMNVSPNLVELDLYLNLLEGPIPYEFGSIMNSLKILDLGLNKLKDGLKSLGNICTLRSLSLDHNHLIEDFSTILQALSGCAKYSLQYLDLRGNQITGTLVDLSTFTSLETFDISRNWLNGTIPKDLQFPSQLVSLYINSNSLKGVLTDSHFADMPNLKNIDLSDNSLLALRFSQSWVPQFQLQDICLRSCKLGPRFPKWLQTQHNFTTLDISNAGISGTIPKWFPSLTQNLMRSFNISFNNLWGTIPNFPIRYSEYLVISLASNHFEGSIPQFLHNVSTLNLSNNKISKLHMFLCANGASEVLGILDLSNNQLSGQLPNCWSHFKSLVYLDLSNNNLSGAIPTSFGSLHNLQVLILRNNRFIGHLPFPLKSCSNLVMLDAGENKLSGPIPSWIGVGLSQLRILVLRNNHLFGSLSSHLCYLTNIQFLDLSLNNLSGQILKCFKSFTAMAQDSSPIDNRNHSFASNIYGTYPYLYDLNALLMWKGVKQIFKNTRFLLKGIDLSSNHLIGELPAELGNLIKLVSLNLSRNHLIGEIPPEIGRLTSLEFLDLSRNHFFGQIPSSFAQIDRLTMLDLSYNNLSGKIPIGTQLQSFNSSSYEENFDLCGKPLEKKCPKEEKPQEPIEFQEDKHSLFSKEFSWSMTLGFITGFWGIFGSILFNRSWRHTYFKFLNNLTDTVYVMTIVNVTKCNRWLKGYLEKLG